MARLLNHEKKQDQNEPFAHYSIGKYEHLVCSMYKQHHYRARVSVPESKFQNLHTSHIIPTAYSSISAPVCCLTPI
jgi:hypothetical protein